MNAQTHKTEGDKNQPAANAKFQAQDSSTSTFQVWGNRPWIDAQQKLQLMANNSEEAERVKMYHQMAGHSPQAAQLQAAAAILSSHSISPVTHSVIQRNAVRDAFSAGIQVVIAGERHGRLKKDEERSVWGQYDVSVNAEYDALAVNDDGTSKKIKLDDPYLRLLQQVDGMGELFQGRIYEWARANKDDQVELLKLVHEDCSDAVVQWKDYLETPGDNTQQKHVQLLIEYTRQIERDMVNYHMLSPLDRQIKGDQYLRQASINVELMRGEVRKGYLTQPESNVTKDLTEARSKRMFKNVRKWGAKSTGPTIWKVGERHITDMQKMLSNGAELPHEIALFSQTEYEKAFLELSRVKRAKVSEAFFKTK